MSFLEGIWIPLRAELGGAPLPQEIVSGMTLEIRAGIYRIQNDEGHVRLDDSHRPPTMDLVGEAGPNKGRTIRAIYAFTDDILTICYELGSAERPAEFASEAGTLLFLVSYERLFRGADEHDEDDEADGYHEER